MDTQRITQLVLEAQQGNRSALEALLESCYQDIYYFALKTVKSEDVAADVTQESCLEITKTISQLREPAAFAAWVRRITYHQCTRYFKKAKDVIPDLNEEGESIFDSLPDESQDTEPEAVYADKEFKATMLALVNSLSPEQSSALLLYYYEKMSVQQIAEIQGVPDGTVKSRLNYARKAFKQKVEEYENKTGVRLHAATPISILLAQLFKQGFAELTLPQMPLIGTEPISASAGAGGGVGSTVTSAASGGMTAVGSTAANAIGTAAAIGSATANAASEITASMNDAATAKPSAKAKKNASQPASASTVTKATTNKASDVISDAVTDTSPSPENNAGQANKTKTSPPSFPSFVVCWAPPFLPQVPSLGSSFS